MEQGQGHDNQGGEGRAHTTHVSFFSVKHLPAEAETATGASSSIREAMRRMVDVICGVGAVCVLCVAGARTRESEKQG